MSCDCAEGEGGMEISLLVRLDGETQANVGGPAGHIPMRESLMAQASNTCLTAPQNPKSKLFEFSQRVDITGLIILRDGKLIPIMFQILSYLCSL